MPRTRKKFEWAKSEAKDILLADFEPGGLFFEAEDMKAAFAWNIYKDLPEFAEVSLPQFRSRYNEYRRNAQHQQYKAKIEEQCLIHDRKLHKQPTHDKFGRPLFGFHPAQQLLRTDVRAGAHLIMTTHALYRMRPEYMMFELSVFRHRVYQEIRREKFITYLNDKRAASSNSRTTNDSNTDNNTT